MTTATPIRETLAEYLLTFSPDVLDAAVASVRAVRAAEPPPPLDWEGRILTVADRCFRFARWCRDAGIEDDLVAVDMFVKLLKLGHAEEDAVKIIEDAGIPWVPRSKDERLVAVARGMLDDGFTAEQVREAMASL